MLAAATGRKIPAVSSPSHQFSRISRITTVTNVTVFVTRKMVPNPANRRIADRSVVARDSSCPDCHSSWKPVSSACRCAYRSCRMAFSIPVTALAWTQRRVKFSVAWAAPSPVAASPSSTSRPRSGWMMASSMTDLVSSGMVISVPTDTQAVSSITTSCHRYGRR